MKLKVKILLLLIAAISLTGCLSFSGGKSSLVQAAKNGDLEKVKELIANGADVNMDNGGGSPLMVAAFNSHLEVVEYLLENGADVFQKDEANGWTALDFAKMSFTSSEDKEKIIEILTEKMKSE